MSRRVRFWIAFLIASLCALTYAMAFCLMGNPFSENTTIMIRGSAVGVVFVMCVGSVFVAIYLGVRDCTDPREIPTFPEPSYV